MDDYLALEDLIVERLKDEVPACRNYVYGANSVDQASKNKTQDVSLHVVYVGDVVPDASKGAGRGSAAVITQRWAVVITVQSVREAITGSGARSKAGPVIAKTIDALAGWKPGGVYREMIRRTSPRPIPDKGALHFPLLFECSFTFK